MTTVPMNDLRRDAGDARIAESIADVVRSGWYLGGPHNAEFSAAFARRIGALHCIGVGNGTDALQIALAALLVAHKKEGAARREVVTVANAGGYTTTACYAIGCMPIYVDIDETDQLISIEAAAAALSERTLAVVATHLYGGLVDIVALRDAMDDAGYAHVPILEDCAQAHGLDGRNGTAGSLGTIATFSFYPTKNLGALGDGGPSSRATITLRPWPTSCGNTVGRASTRSHCPMV